MRHENFQTIAYTGECPVPSVSIVESEESTRALLERLVHCAGWQADVLDRARDYRGRPPKSGPSCLVLDSSVADSAGLDLQEFITHQAPMPVILLSSRGDVPTIVRAMKAGAFDFFTKPFDAQALVQTIGQALARSVAVLREQLELRLLRECYESLTPREREVMRLVVSGLLNKQIAVTLAIAEVTVKVHRGQAMRKMMAESLPDLVQMATRLGLHIVSKRRATLEPTPRSAMATYRLPYQRPTEGAHHLMA
jgi:FixJ family two-component response regulator